MAKFTEFPSNSISFHVDQSGQKIDDKEHQFNQGWMQAFSQVSGILSGIWNNVKATTKATSYCSWTPWVGQVYLNFTASGSIPIKMPRSYVGVLELLDSSLVHKENILVDGKEFSVNVSIGDTLKGSLSPKK